MLRLKNVALNMKLCPDNRHSQAVSDFYFCSGNLKTLADTTLEKHAIARQFGFSCKCFSPYESYPQLVLAYYIWYM